MPPTPTHLSACTTSRGRRRFVSALGASLLLGRSAAQAAAQAWPFKPITLVAVTPPGGNSDTYLRILGLPLGDVLKVPVIVENKPGAGGTIAGKFVLDAAADGHAVLGASGSSHVLYPLLAESVPYDPQRDFKPVALIGVSYQMLLVRPDSPFRSVGDLVAAARKEPGRLSFGSPGLFGVQRLAGELLQQQTGIQLVNVPNVRGSSRLDVISGHVDVMFDSAAEEQVRAGTLRALAVTSTKRHPQFPNIPTMQEEGVQGFDVSSWAGAFVSARTPDATVQLLNAAIVAALATAGAKSKLQGLGMETSPMTVAELTSFCDRDHRKWASVVESQKLKSKIK